MKGGGKKRMPKMPKGEHTMPDGMPMKGSMGKQHKQMMGGKAKKGK